MLDKYQILKKYFGYEEFREGQKFLIDNILEEKNVVGVMPTGAGKSMCFQIPAMIFQGITIVISPLISLMKDQVGALNQVGVKAAYINSSLTARQCSKVIENAQNGDYKIIYVAPERLMIDDFLNFCQKSIINMVTIDEAHCISQWGQDFRPSYLKINDFLEALPNTPVVSAFTATATKKVRDDIVDKLRLKNPEILVTGFDRKNLFFQVERPQKKDVRLLEFLEDKKDLSGVVYCSTRKDVEKVSDLLIKNGYLAKPYHAGLNDFERSKNQDDFLYDKINIMVATNAFGMGIDKSNVSYVVHYNMPKNLESYYQEAGRAGRDGSPATCILFYSGRDVSVNMFLIENGQGKEYTDSETERMVKEEDRKRLKEMMHYCNTCDCLRTYILKYFGESQLTDCGNCGNCLQEFRAVDITVDSQKILSCVARTKERYGIVRIIEVLKGSKNAKILQLKLDKVSTYGIMKECGYIRDIINYLILNEFLFATNDEFSILKLGTRANEVLRQRINLEMKIAERKETDYVEKTKSYKSKKGTNAVNTALFDSLKSLRLDLANEQKIPAFMIFSNSTLIDMCMKMPKNKTEFLDVSGVGQVKCDKYGDKFLEKIKGFAGTVEKFSTSKIVDIEISDEDVSIGFLADSINCQLIQKGLKKIYEKTITSWLMENGYVEKKVDKNEEGYICPTQDGYEIGLDLKTKKYDDDVEYFSIISSKESSKYIVEKMDEFI